MHARPSRPLAASSPARRVSCGLLAAALLTCTSLAWGQARGVSAAQQAVAERVAQAGVPLSELAPDAPASHTVKPGDTLWGIARLFLRSPWRWPELWGMNRDEIRNPHLIYPGQVLHLSTADGVARLRMGVAGGPAGEPPTVRVSPRTRFEALSDASIPAINLQAIEAFLVEPQVVDAEAFARAPRIVATPDNRVLLSRGDRAYARAQLGADGQGEPLEANPDRSMRVYRDAVPLKDPDTGEVIAHEAKLVGSVVVSRSETRRTVQDAQGKPQIELEPATIDVLSAREEMRVGDRLLPEPPRSFTSFVPRAPENEQSGRIVSVYGNAVRFAAQNQVVVINRGESHGLAPGHVLALMSEGRTLTDRTDEKRPQLRLPAERNGLMMVFRTFDKVSYALVLQIADGARVGDRFGNP